MIHGRMNVVLISFLLKFVSPGWYFNNVDANEFSSGKLQDSGDFGHVYRPGYRSSNLKEDKYGDIDKELRELDMVKPKDFKDIKEFLENRDSNMQWTRKEPPLRFLSPRDELTYYKDVNKTTDEKQNTLSRSGYLKSVIRPTSFDFSSMLERNLANPFANRGTKGFKIEVNTKVPKKEMPKKVQNISSYFEDNAFVLKSNNLNGSKINWTTCDEFSKKAVFHPDDIVNTKWIPFFMWSRRGLSSAVVHVFSYPSKKIVQEFKTKYERHIQNINWNRPKLFLKENKQILLIARDNNGLFYGIPEQQLSTYAIERNVTLPIFSLRLKIHDPYLAMMYCDDEYAVIMAEFGTQPTSVSEATLEASTLQFKGTGTPVFRNIEEEIFFEKLERDRKLEAESKKIIKIPKFVGDVDKAVRH